MSLTIAVAIAANVAIISAVVGILLRPLPFANSDKIVFVTSGAPGTQDAPFSYLDANDLSTGIRPSFEAFGISRPDVTATLTGVSRPVVLKGNEVDHGYFSVLGARAELGRLFLASDAGTHRVIISDRLWKRYFGGAARALGRRMTLDGTDYVVIGVASPQFRDITPDGLQERDYWVHPDPRSLNNEYRGTLTYYAWGLVRPGVSFSQALSSVDHSMETLIRRYPDERLNAWGHPKLQSALALIVNPVKGLLWLLYFAVLIILIIACANVSSLTLARATARMSELTVRQALGASRMQLAAQFCSEVGLLSIVGGATGLGLGWLALTAIGHIAGRVLPRWESVRIDVPTVVYVVVALLTITMISGVMPAFISRGDLMSSLKATRSSSDRRAVQLRSALVVAEIALALAVVLSAGLVVRSFITLSNVAVGFDARNLYVSDVPGLPRRYRSSEDRVHAIEQVEARLSRIAGVTSVATTSSPPFEVEYNTLTTIPGTSLSEPVDINIVSPSYFATMRIPLLSGRDFTRNDLFAGRQVAIVTREFARRYFGTLDAVGRPYHPHIGWKEREIRTIIGVADDTRIELHASVKPLQYLSVAQVPMFGYFVFRTSGRIAGLSQAVRDAYSSVDPSFVEPTVKPYDELFSDEQATARLAVALFASFALIGLLLALTGIYGVTTYNIEQRTREFGIRKALGATDGSIVISAFGMAARTCVLGIAIGLVIAALGAQLLKTILFHTSPLDLDTFIGAIFVVMCSSTIAALIPALRAIRVPPAVALRYE